MFRFPIICAAVLILVGCEKTELVNETVDDHFASNDRKSRHKDRRLDHSLTAENSDTLRTKYRTAANIESSKDRDKALAEITWNAIGNDPEIANESFGILSSGSPEKLRLIQHYAIRLAEQNLDEALEWAGSLQSETEISLAMSRIALEIAETNPVRAANLLSEFGISGRDYEVAVVQVIQRWASQSPSDAAAWVSSFQPGATREAGLGIVSKNWLSTNPSAAFAWFNSLQDEKLREETARAMEGFILLQDEDDRSELITHANSNILAELETQREAALLEVGDNIQAPHPPTQRTP